MRYRSHDPHLHALLIGIDDYSPYDRAAGLPRGTSSLQGAVSDVRTWWRSLIAMGASPANITILTAPRLSQRARQAQGARIGGASRAEIITGTRWLQERLERGPRDRGLFVFAGHGAVNDDGELGLCPADTSMRQGSLTEVVPYAAMIESIIAGSRHDNLFAVIDACHAGGAAASPLDRRRSIRPAPPGVTIRRQAHAIPLLVACQPEESSFEFKMGTNWHGAFSWSLIRVLQRWGLAEGGPGFRISYQDLISRSTALLHALGFDQTPDFYGSLGEEQMSVFHPRQHDSSSLTSRHPRLSNPRELDPDVYDIIGPDRQTLGSLVITGERAQQPWTPAHAWWFYTPQNNPFLLERFSLVLHSGPPLSLDPAEAAFSHANTVFAEVSSDEIPPVDVWMRWQREGSDIEAVGHLGLRPPGRALDPLLVWLTDPEAAGSLETLAPGEVFSFIRQEQAPEPSERVAMVLDA